MLPNDMQDAIKAGRLWDYINSIECSKCGCTGLHACMGKRPEPLTPEREAELLAVLRRIGEQEGRL